MIIALELFFFGYCVGIFLAACEQCWKDVPFHGRPRCDLDLSKWTVKQLRQYVKAHEIKGLSKLNKQQLLEVL